MGFFLGLLLSVTSVFLILLVLVQRGRGGGLTGALGGMGGQSAFGAKAGDVFTRITVVTAAVWIILCVISVKMLGTAEDRLTLDADLPPSGVNAAPKSPGATPSSTTPAASTPATNSAAPAASAPAENPAEK